MKAKILPFFSLFLCISIFFPFSVPRPPPALPLALVLRLLVSPSVSSPMPYLGTSKIHFSSLLLGFDLNCMYVNVCASCVCVCARLINYS